MNRITLFVAIFFIAITTNAQVHTLPIENEELFLKNTTKASGGYTFSPAIEIDDLFFLQPTIGYVSKNIIFKDKMIFENNDGVLSMYLNEDSTFEYPDKFFKKGYTKLSGHYIRTGVGAGVIISEIASISAGLNVDFRVYSIYKNKYYIDGKKKIGKVKGNDILKLNGTQFGIYIGATIYGVGISYTYALNNFLKDDWGTDVRIHTIGMIISM